MLADFSSEHTEYIVKIVIAIKGLHETSNGDLRIATCSTSKIGPIYKKDKNAECSNYTHTHTEQYHYLRSNNCT